MPCVSVVHIFMKLIICLCTESIGLCHVMELICVYNFKTEN
jgi:hypothetical protein